MFYEIQKLAAGVGILVMVLFLVVREIRSRARPKL